MKHRVCGRNIGVVNSEREGRTAFAKIANEVTLEPDLKAQTAFCNIIWSDTD